MRAWRHNTALSFLLCSGLVACGDDPKRPIGATCGESGECASGLCYEGTCLDPEGDDDGDGLINRIEAAQGSNPFSADTDGDGIPDGEEYDGLVARDTDGDGIPDAAESNLSDADFDCLVDALDPRNTVSDGHSSPRIAELCRAVGVCSADQAVLSVMCRDGLESAACEYDGVPNFEAIEVGCDGLDNDCDGQTDEGCDPLSVGLIGHWPLDGDGQDIGPFGDHGTVHGATPTADRFGNPNKAMRFAALNDRIEVPATEHPLGEVTATYAVWVRPDRGFNSAYQGYLNFGEVLVPNRRSGVVRLPGRGCTYYVAEENDAAGEACPPEGHWSHLAVVKQGREVRYFLDGRRVGTAPIDEGQALESTALVIGLSKVLAEGTYEQFRGALDDVRVWGRALTDEEVASLVSDTPAVGSQARPAQSCLHIKEATGSNTDGLAWIDLDGDGDRPPLQIYCDQHTDGGGWGLVWVYGFTDFQSFDGIGNAVTPRPTWPVAMADAPLSTTPPTDPSTPGALDWNVWRELGWAFMVTSDLTDHIACEPGRGSIVHGTTGWTSCRTVKDVTPTCDGVVPYSLYFGPHGPSLSASDLYFYFDGNLGDHWPTHDPCGQNTTQHVTNPARRGGAVWVRPSHQFVEWPQECNEIEGILRRNGMRWIDPDGRGRGLPAFQAECRFDVERGGWTRLAGTAYDAFTAEEVPREYLYTRGLDFYRSPVTEAAWDLQSFSEASGLWHYQPSQGKADVFYCQGGAEGVVGVGCGPDPEVRGETSRVIPTEFDVERGSATVCQAPPDIFATGEMCSEDVAIWTRRHYCMPDEGQILGDGEFDQLAAAEYNWQSPCWQTRDPSGFKQRVTVDMNEAPPGGRAPSLRADNPTIGNGIYDLMFAQRRFSLVEGRRYTLSFWARASAPRSIRVFAQPTTYHTHTFFEDILLQAGWRHYELGFEARETFWSTTIDFQLAESSTETVWIDNVKLTEDGPTPCGPTPDNLLGNGDFSVGRACWRFGNHYPARLAGMWAEPDGGPDNGPRAVIELLGQPTEGWHAVPHYEHLHLERGRRYRVTVQARADINTAMYVSVGRWDLGLEPQLNIEQPVTTEWRTYTHDFVAHSDSPLDGGSRLEFAMGDSAASRIELAGVKLEAFDIDPCYATGFNTFADPEFAAGLSCWPFEFHWAELDLYAEVDPEINGVRVEVSNNTAPEEHSARITQHGMTLRAGHGYVLRWQSRAETTRRGYVNIQDWPTLHLNMPVHYAPQWTENERAWEQAVDSTTAKIEIGFGGPLATGSTWFRGLELRDLGPDSCNRLQGFRVANGDFGRSHLCWRLHLPWDEVKFEAVSDPSTFGSFAPSIRLDYAVRTEVRNVGLDQRGLTFTNGRSYMLRFRAKASAPVSPWVRVSEDNTGMPHNAAYFELGSEWREYTLDFIASGATPGNGLVDFQLHSQATPVSIWLDDVEIIEVPAP